MALNPLLSLIGRLVARSGRKRGNRQTDRQTDRQNDKTATVTLAAHARRGLIIIMLMYTIHVHVYQQNRHIIFHALVALKLLVSLISRLVACSPRIVIDRQRDRHTERLL